MRSTTEVLPSGLNSLITTTYTWRDNGNRVFDPGEVNFSLSGPDFVSVAGGVLLKSSTVTSVSRRLTNCPPTSGSTS